MAIELAGAIVIGALTSVVTWLLRRHAWSVAYWIGASLLSVFVITFASSVVWVFLPGQGGDGIPNILVVLILAASIAVSWTINALIVGAMQARTVKRPFVQVVVSGYFDCALLLVLSHFFIRSIFVGSVSNYTIILEAAWLATLVLICVTTRQGRVDAE